MKIKRNQKIERTSKKQGPNGTPVKAAPKPKIGTQIIPKERYTSRDYMHQEWDKLWTKVWLLACREEDLPEPGDHYVTEIGVESILLVRQKDMSIRAFIMFANIAETNWSTVLSSHRRLPNLSNVNIMTGNMV